MFVLFRGNRGARGGMPCLREMLGVVLCSSCSHFTCPASVREASQERVCLCSGWVCSPSLPPWLNTDTTGRCARLEALRPAFYQCPLSIQSTDNRFWRASLPRCSPCRLNWRFCQLWCPVQASRVLGEPRTWELKFSLALWLRGVGSVALLCWILESVQGGIGTCGSRRTRAKHGLRAVDP